METRIQEYFKTLTETMKTKIRLIAGYMENDMEPFAVMELDHLDQYLDAQLKDILELVPDSRQI